MRRPPWRSPATTTSMARAISGRARADGGGNGRVFVVHETHDFKRRHAVKVSGGGKNLFSGKPAKVGFLFSSLRDCVKSCAFRGIWKANHFSTSVRKADSMRDGSRKVFARIFFVESSRPEPYFRRREGSRAQRQPVERALRPRSQRFDNCVMHFRPHLLDRLISAVRPCAVSQ